MSSRDVNDPFYFLPSDSLFIPILNNTSDDSSSNILSNVFSVIFDNLLEGDRFNEAVQNSMDTYNEELFKNTNEYKINLESVSYDSDCSKKQCFICLEKLQGKVYDLPCHHIFHENCMEQAISHQHTKCPLCFKEIPVTPKKPWTKEEYEHSGHKISISSPSD
jgi:hypothetical protein